MLIDIIHILGASTPDWAADLVTKDALQSLIWQLPIMDPAVEKIVIRMSTIAATVGVCFFAIMMGYSYLKTNVNNLQKAEPEHMDISEIVYGGVMLLFIIFYLPFIEFTIGAVELINRSTSPTSEIAKHWEDKYQEFNKKADKVINNAEFEANQNFIKYGVPAGFNPDVIGVINKEQFYSNLKGQSQEGKVSAPGDNTSGDEPISIRSLFANINKFINRIINGLVGGFIMYIAGLVKLITIFITIITAKVIICLGPFAIAFSIIPVFRSQVEIWFNTLIGTMMVFTTFNILDSLFGATITYIGDQGDYALTANSVFVYATFLVLYLMAFWLTSKMVGKGDSGRVLTKAVGLAALAITGGAAAAGGAGASNVGAALDAGKDALKPE